MCDRHCVTEDKNVKEADVMVQAVQNHSVCDKCYVTKTLMLFGLLLEPKLW